MECGISEITSGCKAEYFFYKWMALPTPTRNTYLLPEETQQMEEEKYFKRARKRKFESTGFMAASTVQTKLDVKCFNFTFVGCVWSFESFCLVTLVHCQLLLVVC